MEQEYLSEEQEKIVGWANIEEDGWGVILTDKASTEPVNTPICAYINGKPVVSTSNMFTETDENGNHFASQTKYIDVSEWVTNNVINMNDMFAAITVEEIKGLNTLNTMNVVDMRGMFFNCSVDTIDLSGLDTSNVTDMMSMFYGSTATTIKLSSEWKTGENTNMSYMFANSTATTIDLSGLDTSNVTDITSMFYGSTATYGYARTQEDADKFNNVSITGIPNTLIFSVIK